MLTRIALVVCFFGMILVVPGCLDEADRAGVGRARAYLSTLADKGDPVAASARDELDALLQRSDSESAALTTLLGMIGLGGAGGALKLIMRYRAVAVDIVHAISAAKQPTGDATTPTYQIDKAEVRKAMSPATLRFVESVRARIERPVVVEVPTIPPTTA